MTNRPLDERLAVAMGIAIEYVETTDGLLPHLAESNEGYGATDEIAAYSTDPAASDSLIDWMEREGFMHGMYGRTVSGANLYGFHRHADRRIGSASYTPGDTPSRRLAIAEAAAEALGV